MSIASQLDTALAPLTEALKAKDKKVVAAFTDKKAMEGHLLSSDGQTLRTMGMGAGRAASSAT